MSSQAEVGGTGGAAAGGAGFVRRSSGLVRTGTPYRMFLMNCAYNGLGTYMAFFYFVGAGAFPRGNLLVGCVIVALMQIVFNFAYALLAAAYPRSGGEYVYISRIIHPSIGFAVNFGAAVAQTFWVAVGGYWVCTLVLAPVLSAYAGVTGSSTAASWATWISTPHHAWLIGAVSIVLAALLLTKGLDAYYRYQSINWWIGWALFALFLVIFLFSSHQDFVNGVNRYGAFNGHVHNAYQGVLTAASKAGMPTSFSLWQSLGVSAVFTAVAATAYLGGEVRNPRRTQLIGMVGGSGTFAILSVVMALLIAHVVGLDWNRAASYLSLNGLPGWHFSVSPLFMWYGFLLTTNKAVLILMAAGFVIWSYFWIPICMLFATRMIFAWSFDRVVPARFADVSEKNHSPTVAVWSVAALAEVILYLYQRGTIVYLAPIILYSVVWAFIGLTALLMPFLPKTRAQFEDSTVNWRVAGIPIISIVGFLGMAYWVMALYWGLTTDVLGANSNQMKEFAIGSFAIPFIYYFVIRQVRRQRGIDLDLTFSELPPD
jgi:amino acid transporter